MKTLFAQGLPDITPGSRIEWRVRESVTPAQKAQGRSGTCRYHSQVLVAPDGREIATLAKDAVDDARACLC